ncbi:MAG: carboxyl-terminal processing protease [Candidatus Midichloriaceae bacterium]|jgi:carboxyl-terminal processing protease
MILRIVIKISLFSFFLFCNSILLGDQKYKDLKVFEDALGIIENQYIEQVENKRLIENAINGMLTSLDPYSAFLNKEEYDDMKIATKGEFGGIGVEVKDEQGLLKIVSAYKNLPAYKAGIRTGDIIVAIDDETVGGLSYTQSVDRLKGELGASVRLKVYKESGELQDYKVIRESIKVIPTKILFFHQDMMIYIKIGSFNDKTSNILKAELLKMFNNHKIVKGIILDLRDNPGGMLDQAVEVSQLFLSSGNIVTLKTKNDSEEMIYEASNNEIAKGVPMVILINNGSASASEIVAGALQDNHRALVMGEKSYCKGLIQNIIPFVNGSAIKITVAKFYTPSGRSIQEDCIIPDIEVKKHISNQENINDKTIKDLRLQDYVLQRAIDLLKGIGFYQHNMEK